MNIDCFVLFIERMIQMRMFYQKPTLRYISGSSGLFCGDGTTASGDHELSGSCESGAVPDVGGCVAGGSNTPTVCTDGSADSTDSAAFCVSGIAISNSGNNCDFGGTPGP